MIFSEFFLSLSKMFINTNILSGKLKIKIEEDVVRKNQNITSVKNFINKFSLVLS